MPLPSLNPQPSPILRKPYSAALSFPSSSPNFKNLHEDSKGPGRGMDSPFLKKEERAKKANGDETPLNDNKRTRPGLLGSDVWAAISQSINQDLVAVSTWSYMGVNST